MELGSAELTQLSQAVSLPLGQGLAERFVAGGDTMASLYVVPELEGAVWPNANRRCSTTGNRIVACGMRAREVGGVTLADRLHAEQHVALAVHRLRNADTIVNEVRFEHPTPERSDSLPLK